MKTNEIGTRAEINCAARYTDCGYVVSFPLGGAPYDILCDGDEGILRVQVKNGRKEGDRIEATLHTRYQKEGEWVSTVHDSSDIDEFAIYCYETDSVYRIPVEEAPDYQITLRLDISESSGISKAAEEYELSRHEE